MGRSVQNVRTVFDPQIGLNLGKVLRVGETRRTFLQARVRNWQLSSLSRVQIKGKMQ
jgi:hypothetical protein